MLDTHLLLWALTAPKLRVSRLGVRERDHAGLEYSSSGNGQCDSDQA